MSGHTPGPWTIRWGTNVGAVRSGAEWAIVAACGGFATNTDKGQHHDENESNTRLIAAAPELLAALKECADELEEWVAHHYGDDVHPALERKVYRDMEPVRIARAAIAKAEGGAA